MSNLATKKYLDLTQLQAYDTLIKSWANDETQVAYKTVLKSTDGNNLYFYKKPNAVLGTDTPDATIALGGGDMQAQLEALASVCGATWDSSTETYSLALDQTFDQNTDTVLEALNELKGQINILNGNDSTSGSVAKSIKDAIEGLDVTEFPLAEESNNVVTIHGIKEIDGEISVGTSSSNDIVLEEVAFTGAAEDVSFTKDSSSELSATDVNAAILELEDNIGSLETDSAVTIFATTSPDYAAVYEVYQGDDGTHSASKKIGTINIPKDMVVTAGIVVDITYSDGHLYEGATDVTEAIKGAGVTPTAADAGKYIKLTIANAAQTSLYIKATDLVDIYTGGTTAEVTVDITNNVITATIGTIDGAKIIYKTETSAGAGDGETVKAALTRLDGSDSTVGSVSKKIKDAIEALDTSSDITLAANDSSTGAVTFTSAISESDGIVDGGDDTIIFTPITTSEINALFS